jgi:hypothetical protein
MSGFLDLAETIRRHGLFGAPYTDPGKVPDFSMSSRADTCCLIEKHRRG